VKFKIGNSITYTGCIKRLFGCSGIIIRECPILSTYCVIVQITDGTTHHMPIKFLKLNEGQLVFDFYARLIK